MNSCFCQPQQVDPDPGKRDEEELIQIIRVGLPELRSIMASGNMMLPSVVTCHMALEELQSRDL